MNKDIDKCMEELIEQLASIPKQVNGPEDFIVFYDILNSLIDMAAVMTDAGDFSGTHAMMEVITNISGMVRDNASIFAHKQKLSVLSTTLTDKLNEMFKQSKN